MDMRTYREHWNTIKYMKSVYETFVILVTNVINHLIKKRHVQFDHVDIFIVTPRHFGGGEKK